MSCELMHMFYVPLVKIDCDNWSTKKKKLLNLYKKNSLVEYDQNNNQVKTDYHKQLKGNDFTYCDDVQNIFADELQLITNILKLSSVKIISCWFEEAEKNEYHEIHNHGSLGYSAVCFLEYDENAHTSTRFIAPFINFIDGSVLHYQNKLVKEGSILVFPSSIAHFTEPNKFKKIRKIISFNLNVTA